MKEDYILITSFIYVIYAFYFDNGMKLNDDYTTKLYHLLQNIIMKIIKKVWNWI